MTWLLDWTHVFGATQSREVIDEFARWTADELDYLVEARQAVLLHEHASGDRYERIARVYRDYTTSRVLTTELIEGIPLIEIMVAKREGDQAYLDALAAARPRPRPDRPPPRLEHAQPGLRVRLLPRRPAPGEPVRPARRRDRLRRLRDRRPAARPVRESLTRYSWLLFRGEVEAAVRELMRWLAPAPATDAAAARWQLIRVHQAFLYDDGRRPARASTARGSRADAPAEPENPYSKLAVDILETIRDTS